MGRPTKSSVEHFKERADGRKGCFECAAVATRWMDFANNGQPKFVRTAYCDNHGDWELKSPHVTQRKIRG